MSLTMHVPGFSDETKMVPLAQAKIGTVNVTFTFANYQ